MNLFHETPCPGLDVPKLLQLPRNQLTEAKNAGSQARQGLGSNPVFTLEAMLHLISHLSSLKWFLLWV